MTVVIPALNAAATIERQLAALARQDYAGDWEVVVADNGSVDATVAIVASWTDRLPRLRVADAAGPHSVSHARNRGARAAHGDLLLFCDADDEVSPGWVSAMAEAARSADVLGGGMEVLPGTEPTPERPEMFGSELDVIGGFLPYALGANAGVWRQVFDELGGFDETYAGGGDDVDFSWRAQLAGFRLAAVPHAVIRYRHRGELRGLWRQYFRYGRADPKLYRAFREHGMARSAVVPALARIAWLVVRAPVLLWPGTRRGDWVWKAAWRSGRIAGSLRERTLYL